MENVLPRWLLILGAVALLATILGFWITGGADMGGMGR